MVQVCALASGSNGNCYYVGNETDAVLVDVGISRRQLLDRMNRVNLNIKRVKAIFISHEHSDHVRGVRVLAKNHNIPVYMTEKTYARCRYAIRPQKYIQMTAGETIKIGDVEVFPFAKQHDAADPCSFSIQIEDKIVGVLTDIGFACEQVTQQVKRYHLMFLESNYDEKLLWQGAYPAFLKQRVTSDYGHLSNEQALKLVQDHAGDHLSTIFLSHISEDNNRIELALNAFDDLKSKFTILPTNRYAASDLVSL